MYDPDLHLFASDDEVSLANRLHRMVHSVRRESLGPVLAPDGKEEGTALGYAAVRRDAGTGRFSLWYMSHNDRGARLAVSADGREWTRRGFAFPDRPELCVDNLGVAPVGRRVAPWFQGATCLGFAFCKTGVDRVDSENLDFLGAHLFRSPDGERLELDPEVLLRGVGDRSSLMYDEVADEYTFVSRANMRRMPRKIRVANMWKSADLVHWENRGVALRADEFDRSDAQIYGMQPFRYGNGFLGLVEVYYSAIERLETQLAWSADGARWQRVGGREAVIPMGGEGAWDSHWTVPTINPPIPDGDRLLIFYTGGGTKHGSGKDHRRAIGLASIRRDGFVSFEAGREEGLLVTARLRLERPMKLEVNVNCATGGGYLAVEVAPGVMGREDQPLAGYEAEKSRIESADAVRRRVTWGDTAVVEPVREGKCHLRFTLRQASFFSYRWSEAE